MYKIKYLNLILLTVICISSQRQAHAIGEHFHIIANPVGQSGEGQGDLTPVKLQVSQDDYPALVKAVTSQMAWVADVLNRGHGFNQNTAVFMGKKQKYLENILNLANQAKSGEDSVSSIQQKLDELNSSFLQEVEQYRSSGGNIRVCAASVKTDGEWSHLSYSNQDWLQCFQVSVGAQ